MLKAQCREGEEHFWHVVDLLKVEAEAIHKAACRLESNQVEQAIALLQHCQGKVIVLGMGKSGIVGQKIAATMTSTGTVAIYLHPSDALHGDLGMVAAADVAILLSNSGQTEELLQILPYLHHRQVPIIAIVGNLGSPLARKADVVLDASVDREACPLNLAPTTSTTVALAIGDALSMALAKAKNLTPEAFAMNHPAGSLGRRLTLRVRHLMQSGSANPTVDHRASLVEIIAALTRGSCGAVNVVDPQGHLLGLITDGDLRRVLQRMSLDRLDTVDCAMMMTPNPVVVEPDCLAYDALKLMEERASPIAVLPVVDQQHRSVGIVRLHDIVQSGL